MKNFFKNIWNWLKGLFTNIYNQPIISIEDFSAYLSEIDKNGDGKLSANEIWNGVKDKIFK